VEQKFTIVIVDDSDESLLLFRRYIDQLFHDRFHVNTFSDPAKALEFIANNQVSVVVSDLHMPEISGNDLLRQSKAMKKGIQFYVQTADHTASAALVSFLDGADGFFLKPLDKATVAEELGRCIERLDAWNRIFESAFKKQSA